ncbi:MAG: EamA family transporter [Eubacteriales bacterium]|nr:EamA family transporter [Eubacteriales bacterium]
MESNFTLNMALMIFGVVIAALSQVILKKAAMKHYDTWLKQYLNAPVILAYFIFFVSSFCSVIALKVLPLSLMPVWNASSYFFVTLFAYLIMKEKPNRRKLIGLGVLFAGIAIFSLPL